MVGLMAFFGVLLNNTSCCLLEMMDMRVHYGHVINDQQQVDLENIMSHALCNKSSVDFIYSLNHTLSTILMENNWSQEIMSLLELNRNEDKVEVVHHKTLRYHFSNDDGTAIQVFSSLSDAFLPSAQEWIGRGTQPPGILIDVQGYSLLSNTS